MWSVLFRSLFAEERVRMPASQGGCPVPHEQRERYMNQQAYNVYGEKINPANQMPQTPFHLPVPGQKVPLSQERVHSSIPKGGSAGTWSYPSEQQFYDALHRKGKKGDVTEHDVSVVVTIHNRMNERTWARVKQWEQLHASACQDPRLLRFKGRAKDFTLTARWRHLLGGELPFDRHDWIVDRCGREVRYIIDYYTNSSVQAGHDKAIEIHVRPALDSLEAVMDRCRVAMGRVFGVPGTVNEEVADRQVSERYQHPFDVSRPNPDDEVSSKEEFEYLTSLTQDTVAEVVHNMQVRCAGAVKRYQDAGENTEQRESAHVEIRHCMAAQVQSCQQQAAAFAQSVAEGADGPTQAQHFASMNACVARFTHMVNKVLARSAMQRDAELDAHASDQS